MLEAIISIAIAIILAPPALLILKRRLGEDVSSARRRLDGLKRRYEKIASFDKRVGEERKAVERELAEISQLYELARDMGAALDFKRLFEILLDRLAKLFTFASSKLMLLDTAEGKFSIYTVYSSKSAEEWRDGRARGIEVIGADSYEIPLIERLYKDKERRHIFLTGPDERNPFLAVPLVSRDRLLGVLTAERIRGEGIDKFLILAGQFALEVEKIRLYNEVQELAITDGLTDVFLRRHLFERFEEEIRRSRRHRLKLSCLMFDIDNFKQLNDRFGHLVGDVVLKEIAGLIKSGIREIDIVGRFGGEEFCAVLPETDKDSARLVAERIREAAAAHIFRAYDEVLKATISIGISGFPEDAAASKGLLEFADKALYKAKRDGKNRVCVYGE